MLSLALFFPFKHTQSNPIPILLSIRRLTTFSVRLVCHWRYINTHPIPASKKKTICAFLTENVTGVLQGWDILLSFHLFPDRDLAVVYIRIDPLKYTPVEIYISTCSSGDTFRNE